MPVAGRGLERKPSQLERIYESIRDFLYYALGVFASILINVDA